MGKKKNPGVITDSFGKPLGLCAAASKESQEHVRAPSACVDKTVCPVTVHNLHVSTASVQYLAPPASPLVHICSLTGRSQKSL